MKSGRNDFWDILPWQAGPKHRLMLRPIEMTEWLADDAGLLRNKSDQLKNAYGAVVAQVPSFEPPQAADLPWQSETDEFPHWVANFAAHRAEDICLVDVTDEQRFVAGCVAAPSYWSLHEKIGNPLFTVHDPVEGMNAKIGAQVDHFFQNMPVGQPFRRVNWLVHGTDRLFSAESENHLGDDVSKWWFRSEQQVLFRMNTRHVLFTIRVVQAPVTDLAGRHEAAQTLCDALRSMDADEISHFGGRIKYDALTSYVTLLLEQG